MCYLKETVLLPCGRGDVRWKWNPTLCPPSQIHIHIFLRFLTLITQEYGTV